MKSFHAPETVQQQHLSVPSATGEALNRGLPDNITDGDRIFLITPDVNTIRRRFGRTAFLATVEETHIPDALEPTDAVGVEPRQARVDIQHGGQLLARIKAGLRGEKADYPVTISPPLTDR